MLCCQEADTLKGTSRPKCLLILRLIGATIDSTKIGRNKLSIPLNAPAAKRSSRDTSLAFMFYRFLEHIFGIIFRQMKNRTSWFDVLTVVINYRVSSYQLLGAINCTACGIIYIGRNKKIDDLYKFFVYFFIIYIITE